jgi:uncharacterized protein (TIGR02246 family)
MGTKDEIRAIDDAYEKAVANQDINAVGELYAPDAKLLAPNAPMATGRGEIQALLQGFLDAGAQSLELHTVETDDLGDTVIEVGTYRLGLQPPGGEPITDEGKYLQVFKRQSDDSFQLAFDAFNSDLPAG